MNNKNYIRKGPNLKSRAGGRSQRGLRNRPRTRRDDRKNVSDLNEFRGREGKVGDPNNGMISNTFIPAFNTQRYRAKLRYGVSPVSMTSLVSQVARYVFSANGLFDPNITGGALQPAGFAQLMLSYNHYTVLRSKISIFISNKGTVPAYVGLAVLGDFTGSTDPSNMFELPRENLIFLDPAGQHGSTKVLSAVCDIARFQGVDDPTDNPDLQGNLIANPVEQSYFHVLGYNSDSSASSFTISAVIDYDAMFQEPRELSPSLTKVLLNTVGVDEKEKKFPHPLRI